MDTTSQTDGGGDTDIADTDFITQRTRSKKRKKPATSPTTTENQPIYGNNTTGQPLAALRALPTFAYTYNIYTKPTTTRIQLATLYEKYNTKNTDIIIKQQDHFLLKTNNNQQANNTLQQLQTQKCIISYANTTTPNASSQPPKTSSTIQPSYSVIVTGVELEITDSDFHKHLTNTNNFNVRYCKRIISKERQKPTLMIRLITGHLQTYEKLMTCNGIFYLGRIYRIIESKPPQPIPAPCAKCNKFDHTTDKCTNAIKCTKCDGPHNSTHCKSPLPPKCTACQATDHAAWSTKCPNRPTKPIDGIPNVKIKCTNKKTEEMQPNTTRNSRIHKSITIHDYIINKIKNDLNKTNNTDRESLLKKLKRRFIEDFNTDTNVVFFGNQIYILILDLSQPDQPSATEPRDQIRQVLTQTQ